MATGAGDKYWKSQSLPSVFKHALLNRYVPQFAGMTGSRSAGRRVVFLDGYAGRGRYEDGSPGSAERILLIARNQRLAAQLVWTCFFVEADVESADMLKRVVREYAADGSVTATAHHGSVLEILDEVIATATDSPLFLFLDPCGLGVPYTRLVSLPQASRRRPWPPTEVLLNFSLDGVRRIGGHVNSAAGNETTMRRLDEALGGAWWRDLFADRVTDEAVDAVVSRFSADLGHDTRMDIVSVPVRRGPWQKPVYHLVFGTRSQHGLWAFGDSVARATQEWWDTLDEIESGQEPGTLFTATSVVRPSLDSVESAAVQRIAENLARLLRQAASFKVVERTADVFGEDYGQVREPVVRQAVKLLHRRGDIVSDGTGRRVRDLIVVRR